MRPPTAKRVLVAAALLVLAAGGTAGAATLAFIHAGTIYRDEMNVPLSFPEGVACSDAGAIVVADTGNRRLVRFTYRDGQLSGGSPVTVPQVAYPTRVQIDSKGNILVLDRKTRRIARLDMAGTFLSFLEIGAPGAPAQVGAFKLDAQDNVYVQDLATDKLLVVAPTGNVTRELPLPRGAVTDVGVDLAGTVYAAEAGQAAIWVADRAATAFKALSSQMREYLSFPGYVLPSGGRVFVVDQNGHGLVILGPDGSYQGRQLGLGWSEGFLYYPSQICFTQKGDAFVADRSNNRVQVFRTTK